MIVTSGLKRIPASLVRKCLSYREDGNLIWVDSPLPHRNGMIAGANNGRYWSVTLGAVKMQRSHLIFAWHYARWPKEGLQIDHINRNPFDDRIENLREVSVSKNGRNRSNSQGLTRKQDYLGVKNPTLFFQQRMPPEIYQEKCIEFERLIQPWVESIEDFILGNLPSDVSSVEEAVKVIQCTDERDPEELRLLLKHLDEEP